MANVKTIKRRACDEGIYDLAVDLQERRQELRIIVEMSQENGIFARGSKRTDMELLAAGPETSGMRLQLEPRYRINVWTRASEGLSRYEVTLDRQPISVSGYLPDDPSGHRAQAEAHRVAFELAKGNGHVVTFDDIAVNERSEE
jgi:hypothetical protein